MGPLRTAGEAWKGGLQGRTSPYPLSRSVPPGLPWLFLSLAQDFWHYHSCQNFCFSSLKHKILSWPSTDLAMYELKRSFGAIKTNMQLPFAFDTRSPICTLLVRKYANVNTACLREVPKGLQVRKNNIEGALMTKTP